MPTVGSIVGNVDLLMGVKAVFGRSAAPVMCFGSHGNEKTKDRGHFSLARRAAEKAIEQPYLVTIGGGDDVPSELDGRVLEVVRITGAFGETKAFVHDANYLQRLTRWPVAVLVSEIYQILGEPHLVDDLEFSNRQILANAYDGIRRDDVEINRLWNALRQYEVRRRWDIKSLPSFRDPRKVQMYGTMYPKTLVGSAEGAKIWKEQQLLERDRRLSRDAKDANRSVNHGVLVCEACSFSNANSALFDAHHLEPLACGARESRVDDFAVLCPTCHRWAHVNGIDRLQPLPIMEIKVARIAPQKGKT